MIPTTVLDQIKFNKMLEKKDAFLSLVDRA